MEIGFIIIMLCLVVMNRKNWRIDYEQNRN